MKPLSSETWLSKLTVALALVAVCGCASSGRNGESKKDVNWLVRHGRFEEAVRRAADLSADAPDDEHAKEVWKMATVAWLLEQGRRLTFEDQDVEALEKFEAAVAIEPKSTQAQAWRTAALQKLSGQWVTRAIEAHAADDLDEAVRCYESALRYVPDQTQASEGLGRALLQLNYRRGMGESYYERGVKALSDYWLEQASHHFTATLKYDENDRAERRRSETATLRADNRALIAADLEDAGQYAAARNEYRIATLFDPEHAEALAGLERMKVEEQAAEFLREAERRKLRKDFDAAQAALDAGAAITVRQKAVFDSQRDALVAARLQSRYEAAVAIESDHRYEDAVAAYDELLELAPGHYFADVIARRDTLNDFVARAAATYEEALASDDPERQAELLRQIQIVYPEYKDSIERLKVLDDAAAQAATEQALSDEPSTEQPPSDQAPSDEKPTDQKPQ